MNQKTSPIIKPEELLALDQGENLIIVNAGNGRAARESFAAGHLRGALFVDLDSQLADVKADAANGGRHPLPSAENFGETLGDLGIALESRVVIYDDKQGANAAARFWWMLKAVGHETVQVVDGGFQAVVKGGFPVETEIKTPAKKTDYTCEKWLLPTACIAEVERASNDKDFLIVDVREAARYNGEIEPIDIIAGHIPNAKNIPFAENLDENGFFLSSKKLREKYSKDLENYDREKVIVHCGSGVTACHTLLALTHAGFEIPKLYVGSWSEWSRNDLPIGGESSKDRHSS